MAKPTRAAVQLKIVRQQAFAKQQQQQVSLIACQHFYLAEARRALKAMKALKVAYLAEAMKAMKALKAKEQAIVTTKAKGWGALIIRVMLEYRATRALTGL